jgi:hypothetical protein
MSSSLALPLTGVATGSPRSMIVAFAGASNALRRAQVVLRSTVTSGLSSLPAPAPDLGREFAYWADESLEWAQATFEAQSESWPAH